MTFLLSASGMSWSNESSSLLKVSHLVARFFRSHLSKFLSAVASNFHTFLPLEVQFLKFRSVISQVCFISLL